MSGRMNWDRVRQDSLSRARGSEWVKPFEDSQPEKNQSAHSKKKTKKNKATVKMKTCPKCGMRSRGMKAHSKSCIHFPPKQPKIVYGGLFESNRRKH